MARGTEKGTGVHDIKQRGRRFLPVDIFQLGIGLDTEHITAAELTGFRQDLHQVREFMQRGQLVTEKPHTTVTVFSHCQQATNGNGQPHGDHRLQGGMRVGIRRDEQPAVFLIFPDTTHPVTNSEGLTAVLNPLQVTDGFYVVGQHSTDGNRRFLDFLFHQVGRR